MERDEEDHYHGHELKYVPAGNSPVAIPALIAIVAGGFFWLARRRKNAETVPTIEDDASSDVTEISDGLSEAERKLLAAELDDSEEL